MLLIAVAVTAFVIGLPVLAQYAEGRYSSVRRLGGAFSPTSSVQTTVTESYQRQQVERLSDGTSTTKILPNPKGSDAFGRIGAGTRTVTTDTVTDKPVF
jgi:hypothetical protein